MDLKEVLEWLVTNKYVVFHQGKPKFTSVYHKEMTGVSKGLTVKNDTEITTEPGFSLALIGTYTLAQWGKYYEEFIKTCKVPPRGVGGYGSTYAMNKYSEDGMKAFRKAILDGYKLEILLLAVSIYYASTVGFKKAIGNYMSSGEWKTDYETLLEQREQGTVQEHIKQETKKNNGRYEMG
jgi:hypothetical protein